MNSGYASADKI